MDHISTLLPKILRKRGLHDEVDASMVVHTAQAWLNEHGLQHAIVTKVKEGTLFIEVRSPTEAQECFTKSEDLRRHIEDVHSSSFSLKNIRIIRS